jgi:hypothetical protein
MLVFTTGAGVPRMAALGPEPRFGHGDTAAPSASPSCDASSQIVNPVVGIGGATGDATFHVVVRVAVTAVATAHVVGRVAVTTVRTTHVVARVGATAKRAFQVVALDTVVAVLTTHVVALVGVTVARATHVVPRVGATTKRVFQVVPLVGATVKRVFHVVPRVTATAKRVFHVVAFVAVTPARTFHVVDRLADTGVVDGAAADFHPNVEAISAEDPPKTSIVAVEDGPAVGCSMKNVLRSGSSVPFTPGWKKSTGPCTYAVGSAVAHTSTPELTVVVVTDGAGSVVPVVEPYASAASVPVVLYTTPAVMREMIEEANVTVKLVSAEWSVVLTNHCVFVQMPEPDRTESVCGPPTATNPAGGVMPGLDELVGTTKAHR